MEEIPLLNPLSTLSTKPQTLSVDKEKQLKEYVSKTQGLYELSLFAQGEVFPTEYVLNGFMKHPSGDMTSNSENTKNFTQQQDSAVWINVKTLIMYLAWEQTWWTRTLKGKTKPIKAVELYKLVHHEYIGLNRTGTINHIEIKKERDWMLGISKDTESEDVQTKEEKLVEEETDAAEDLVFMKLGLPDINRTCRDKPFTMKELEERKRNDEVPRKKLWFSTYKNSDNGDPEVPTDTKLSFTMRFGDFLGVLREFEKEGFLTIRPVVDETCSPEVPYPKYHLHVFFSAKDGYRIWESLNGYSDSDVPHVMKQYYKQRVKRIIFLSEAELVEGPIYESIKNHGGNPHDFQEKKRRRKIH